MYVILGEAPGGLMGEEPITALPRVFSFELVKHWDIILAMNSIIYSYQ